MLDAPVSVGSDVILTSIRAAGGRFFHRLSKDGISVGLSLVRRTLFGESLAATIAGHLEVERLFTSSQVQPLLKHLPHFSNKYLSVYLAKTFNKAARRISLLHHYRFFAKRTKSNFYEKIVGRRVVLWEGASENHRFAIALSFHVWHNEGDLSLIFIRDDVSLSQLSFTVIPGMLIGIESGDTMLIGCVQGAKNQFVSVREATKECHDIAPAHLLMVAAQSVACKLSIESIAGVSNTEQLTKTAGEQDVMFDYDAFWNVFLAEKTQSGFFKMTVPLRQKPIEMIRIDHRRRTRRKRQFKQRVADEVAREFATAFLDIGGVVTL